MKTITLLTLGIFVVILLMVGVSILFNLRNGLSNKPSPSPVASPSSLEDQLEAKSVQSFYNFYSACMQKPPAQAKGKVAEYCQDNNPFISKNFTKNILAGGVAKAGADPITCSQNPPQKITIDKVDPVQDTKTTAYISESFGMMKIQPKAMLILEDNDWRVDNIICPKP